MSISPTILVFPLTLWFLTRLLRMWGARVKEGSGASVVFAECRGFSRDVMLVGGLGAILEFPILTLVRPNEDSLTYISQMAYVSTVKAPIFRTDITFASHTQGDILLSFSVLECRIPHLVGYVVVYPPKGWALLRTWSACTPAGSIMPEPSHNATVNRSGRSHRTDARGHRGTRIGLDKFCLCDLSYHR